MKIMKIAISVSLLFFTAGIFADDAAIFKKRCGVCHALNSVSKATMGPNLTGVASKRPEEYVKLYMTNPAEAKKKFPDIYKKEVKGKYSATMPTIKVSAEEMAALLKLLK